eukprot:TRINITY_DN10050_c0_g1_i4.p2 TRINITY_DN10050_c0_g1~~TRINITY_DN10050_c0_g1_i4.p2  ORF type:complete len:183 (+),score=17.61 TRINITY_DN10050_c0_g1_i4:804-1352(+)
MDTNLMAMQIVDEPYYKGTMSRDDAERMLAPTPAGTFLFRRSETRNGLSLSIRVVDRVKHYMVTVRDDGRFIVVGKDRDFGSMKELVQYHSEVPPSTTDGVKLLLPRKSSFVEPAPFASGPNDYVSLLDDSVDSRALAQAQEQAQARLKQHRSSSTPSLDASTSSVKRHAYEDDFVPTGPPQ